jgi:hypothetical protein
MGGAYDAQVGFRFYRRVRLFPGLSVNFSRSGPSLSVGVRGAHVTVGRRGVTKTVGLPGTGLFYTSRQGYHTGYHSVADHVVTPPTASLPPLRPEQAGRGRAGLILVVVVALLLGLIVLLSR